MTVTAGVVAVQGDVSEHKRAVVAAGKSQGYTVDVVEIREPGMVSDCDVLLFPGGESTTISRLLHKEGIAAEIRDHVAAEKPFLATCAGLIVAARDAADERVEPLSLLDVTVERNAFGRQKDSFEVSLDVQGLSDPFHAVFIRAPAISDFGDATVIATWNGRPVAVREGPVFGTAFHPELTEDYRIHSLALFEHDMVSPR